MRLEGALVPVMSGSGRAVCSLSCAFALSKGNICPGVLNGAQAAVAGGSAACTSVIGTCPTAPAVHSSARPLWNRSRVTRVHTIVLAESLWDFLFDFLLFARPLVCICGVGFIYFSLNTGQFA